MSMPKMTSFASLLLTLATLIILVESASFKRKGSLRCSSPLGSMDGRILVESQMGEISDFTTLQWQIRLGETVCYRFKSESQTALRGYIEVTYESIRSVYSIANHYFFRLPRSNVKCTCDCPGGGNACSSLTDSCFGQDNCINFYSSSGSSSGCFLKFLKISSSVCCSLGVERLEDKKSRYRAVELSVPNVIAELRVRHLNEDYSVVDSRTYHVDLNSGTSVDWEVSLQMSGAGPSNFLPPGWYMASEMSHDLYGGIPINRLDEWDIHKLGWFKSKRDKDHIEATGHQLRQAFGVEMISCLDNTYRTEFSTPYINGDQLSHAQRVESMFSFIKDVNIWRRTVEIRHRESPLLVLTLQHRNKVGVVMQYHDSSLEDFTGYVLLDRHSNQFLFLNLTGARGSLRGSISSLDSDLELVISTIVSGSSNNASDVITSQAIKLRGGLLCDHNSRVRVSLTPAHSHRRIEKILPCSVDGLRDFDSDLLRRIKTRHIAGGSCTGAGCVVSSDVVVSWKHWLNPFSWGSASPWTTARIALTAMTVLILFSLIISFCRFICCCCCCKSQKSHK